MNTPISSDFINDSQFAYFDSMWRKSLELIPRVARRARAELLGDYLTYIDPYSCPFFFDYVVDVYGEKFYAVRNNGDKDFPWQAVFSFNDLGWVLDSRTFADEDVAVVGVLREN